MSFTIPIVSYPGAQPLNVQVLYRGDSWVDGYGKTTKAWPFGPDNVILRVYDRRYVNKDGFGPLGQHIADYGKEILEGNKQILVQQSWYGPEDDLILSKLGLNRIKEALANPGAYKEDDSQSPTNTQEATNEVYFLANYVEAKGKFPEGSLPKLYVLCGEILEILKDTRVYLTGHGHPVPGSVLPGRQKKTRDLYKVPVGSVVRESALSHGAKKARKPDTERRYLAKVRPNHWKFFVVEAGVPAKEDRKYTKMPGLSVAQQKKLDKYLENHQGAASADDLPSHALRDLLGGGEKHEAFRSSVDRFLFDRAAERQRWAPVRLGKADLSPAARILLDPTTFPDDAVADLKPYLLVEGDGNSGESVLIGRYKEALRIETPGNHYQEGPREAGVKALRRGTKVDGRVLLDYADVTDPSRFRLKSWPSSGEELEEANKALSNFWVVEEEKVGESLVFHLASGSSTPWVYLTLRGDGCYGIRFTAAGHPPVAGHTCESFPEAWGEVVSLLNRL